MAAKEMPLEKWVTEITKARNNNFKMIETLEQRGRNLHERVEHLEEQALEITVVRQSINRIMEHLDITIDDLKEGLE